jgi:CheY-specific phosphatase CheX
MRDCWGAEAVGVAAVVGVAGVVAAQAASSASAAKEAMNRMAWTMPVNSLRRNACQTSARAL